MEKTREAQNRLLRSKVACRYQGKTSSVEFVLRFELQGVVLDQWSGCCEHSWVGLGAVGSVPYDQLCKFILPLLWAQT